MIDATVILTPHSIESEQALLGALMADSEQIDAVGDLQPDAFYRDDHRKIFAAIVAQVGLNRPTDPVSLFSAMGPKADEVGGLAYLGELAHNCASPRSAKRYAEIVREHAIRRALVAAGDSISALGLDRSKEARAALNDAQAVVMGIADQQAFGAREPRLLKGLMAEFLADLEAKMQDGDAGNGISTGFPDLDERIPGGMDEGWLVVLAGRPGTGKSTLALQIADSFVEHGHPALFLSQEMPNMQLVQRWISLKARIAIESLRSPKLLTDDDFERMHFASARAASPDFLMHFDEQGALRMADVVRKCRQVKRKHGLRIAVVDYLQLMVGEGGDAGNRARELSVITAGLKSLAKELRITIIALSQLSRLIESRPNRRPIMSDLKESGSIEQDADMVMGIYRDDLYNDDSMYRGMAELSILKHRSGRVGGFVPLTFNGATSRFDSFFGEWPQPAAEQPKRKRKGLGDDF